MFRRLANSDSNQSLAYKPLAPDRDRIHRGVWALAFAAAAAGAAVVTALPWIGGLVPAAVARVLALDPQFLQQRAPFLLLFWTFAAMLYGRVFAEGRWRNGTRRLSHVLNFAACLLMLWFLLGGPIFQSAATDQATKGSILVFALLPTILSLISNLYRQRSLQPATRP